MKGFVATLAESEVRTNALPKASPNLNSHVARTRRPERQIDENFGCSDPAEFLRRSGGTPPTQQARTERVASLLSLHSLLTLRTIHVLLGFRLQRDETFVVRS